MKSRFRFLYVVGLSLLAASCYEDKGNYDYHDINDIVIETSEYSYTTPKEGQTNTVLIEPTITQTITPGTANLAYEWKRQLSGTSWQVVGSDPTYTLTITSQDTQPIVLRLAVTDLDQEIITYEEITVKPIFKFSQCWFLLQNIDNTAVLGSVDGEGKSREVSTDVYKRETGASLTGKPVGLGMHNFLRTTPYIGGSLPSYEILLGVFTDAKRYVLKGATLEDHPFSYERLLYEKKVNSDATAKPEIFRGSRNNFVAVDAGKLWYALPDEFALMYPIKLSDKLGGGTDYEVKGVGFASSSSCLLYDGKKSRFLSYTNTALTMGYFDRKSIAGGGKDNLYKDEKNVNRKDRIESIVEGKNPNKFDPQSDVPGGYQLDYMGWAAGNQNLTVLAIGHVGTTFTIFEFCPDALTASSTDMAVCNAKWEVVAKEQPVTTNGKYQVTTSAYFERVFFYATDNKIYRVDLSQSTPAVDVVYETKAEYGKIKMMKLKSDYEDVAYDKDNTPPNQPIPTKGIIRHLGVLLEKENGDAKLIELHLTAAGEVELDEETKEPVVYEFNGTFKNVVDLVFSFRDEI